MRTKRPVNYLGFLSLVALLAPMGHLTGEIGFYGFLGFLYYVRYFTVLPDEFFRENVRRAAMAAWLSEMVLLAPLTYLSFFFSDAARALPMGFGLSFAAAIFVFTIALMVYEYREARGAADD